jgi:hypothetical protein
VNVVEVIEIDNKRFAVVQGDDLKSGMIIRRISTLFGVLDIQESFVKEACFSPGCMQGMLLLDHDVKLEPCEADIIDFSYEE